MSYIRLECKSIKQLERTCTELENLGVSAYCRSSKSQAIGVGRGVTFYTEYKKYTCGGQGPCDVGDQKYYKRKEFIAAVKQVLGESK